MRKTTGRPVSRAWLLALLLSAAAGAETLSLTLEKVEDGDTLVALVEGKAERLQLRGIDAPEDVENAKLQHDVKTTGLKRATLLAMGSAASRHLRSLLKPGARLQIRGRLDQRDRYGRILAIVAAGSGRSLNEQMVADGYAVVSRYGAIEAGLKTRLEKQEAAAVAAKRGLWGEYAAAAWIWSGRGN